MRDGYDAQKSPEEGIGAIGPGVHSTGVLIKIFSRKILSRFMLYNQVDIKLIFFIF